MNLFKELFSEVTTKVEALILKHLLRKKRERRKSACLWLHSIEHDVNEIRTMGGIGWYLSVQLKGNQ